MKVLGVEIKRTKGNQKPDSGSTVSQALNVSNFGAFFKDVEHLHNNGGGKVTIMKLKTPSSNPKRIDELDISAVMEEEDFLQFVLDKYKASIYKFQLWNSKKDLYRDHHFTLGEPKDKKGKKKGGKKSGKGSKSFQEEMTLLLMEKAFDSKTSDADQWTRTLELAKALKGDNGITPQDMMTFAVQIAGILQQGQGGSTLEEAATLLEMLQRLQPQQQDEGWGQLVPMVTSLITSFKQGQGAPTPQQAQEIQVLKQQLQSLASAATAGAPGAVAEQPPAPGASASGGGLGGAVESPASPPQASAGVGTEAYFHERFLNPFRRDVAAGEKDDELAYQIVTMTIYARDRMPDNLPPIVADFVNASTMAEYEAALQKFYAAIPELANLTQKQIGIRTALVMNYMSGFVESAEEEVQDLQGSRSIIHIDQDQVVEEASIHDADRGLTDEADAEGGTGNEDLPDNAPDHSELRHENVPSEV